jgi:N-acetylglucosaminyl-diphospho-decaprenol L-rhamnosyltransferase
MGIAGLDQITVVIVTYNSAHCMRDISEHLSAFNYVVIVDNGSSDDIDSAHQNSVPHARLIRLSKNLGFGAANNVALQAMSTSFALLHNPDCILPPDTALALLDVAEQFPEAAIVAPQVVKPNGAFETSYRWPSRQWTSSGPAADGVCCVGFATGAALLLRLKNFSTVGFFDEDYFLYYEDEDLCQRIFKDGRSILIAPHARAVHASRSSVREGFPWRSEYIRGFHHAQSKLIFETKHGHLERVKMLRMRVLVLAVMSFPIRLLWPQPRYLVRLIGRIMGLIRYRYLLKLSA